MKNFAIHFEGTIRGPSEPRQTCGGNNDCVIIFRREFGQSRGHVAADRRSLQIGSRGKKHRVASRTAGADFRPGRQRGQSPRKQRDQDIAALGARQNRPQPQTGGQFGRKIFQTVHRSIGPAVEQRLLQFFGEEAFVPRADLSQFRIEVFIPGRADDQLAHFRGRMRMPQAARDFARLRQSKIAPACGQSDKRTHETAVTRTESDGARSRNQASNSATSPAINCSQRASSSSRASMLRRAMACSESMSCR